MNGNTQNFTDQSIDYNLQVPVMQYSKAQYSQPTLRERSPLRRDSLLLKNLFLPLSQNVHNSKNQIRSYPKNPNWVLLIPKNIFDQNMYRNSPQPTNFKSKKVFVSFSDHSISSAQLRQIFSSFGRLRQAYLCKAKSVLQGMEKASHRYGFVTFFKYKDAQNLVRQKIVKIQGISFKVKPIQFKAKYTNGSRKQRKQSKKFSMPIHGEEGYWNEQHYSSDQRITPNSNLNDNDSHIAYFNNDGSVVKGKSDKYSKIRTGSGSFNSPLRACQEQKKYEVHRKIDRLPFHETNSKSRLEGVLSSHIMSKITERHLQFQQIVKTSQLYYPVGNNRVRVRVVRRLQIQPRRLEYD